MSIDQRERGVLIAEIARLALYQKLMRSALIELHDTLSGMTHVPPDGHAGLLHKLHQLIKDPLPKSDLNTTWQEAFARVAEIAVSNWVKTVTPGIAGERMLAIVSGLRARVVHAAGVFDIYAALHDAKSTPDGDLKAAANRAHAEYMRGGKKPDTQPKPNPSPTQAQHGDQVCRVAYFHGERERPSPACRNWRTGSATY